MQIRKYICAYLLTLSIIIAFNVLLSGCARVITVYGLLDGTYVQSSGLNDKRALKISFDSNNYSISLAYNEGTPIIASGTYKFENRVITALFEDNRYKFHFEIIDNDTIRFIQRNFSNISTIDGLDPIADGTEFIYFERSNNASWLS